VDTTGNLDSQSCSVPKQTLVAFLQVYVATNYRCSNSSQLQMSRVTVYTSKG